MDRGQLRHACGHRRAIKSASQCEHFAREQLGKSPNTEIISDTSIKIADVVVVDFIPENGII